MITIAHCADVMEAQRLQRSLASTGIPSFLPDETIVGVAPHHFLASGGVRFQVAEADAEQARRILAEHNEKPEG